MIVRIDYEDFRNINRTFMELKLSCAATYSGLPAYINRTFMELKLDIIFIPTSMPIY
jgi:hypothetical protein